MNHTAICVHAWFVLHTLGYLITRGAITTGLGLALNAGATIDVVSRGVVQRGREGTKLDADGLERSRRFPLERAALFACGMEAVSLRRR